MLAISASDVFTSASQEITRSDNDYTLYPSPGFPLLLPLQPRYIRLPIKRVRASTPLMACVAILCALCSSLSLPCLKFDSVYTVDGLFALTRLKSHFFRMLVFVLQRNGCNASLYTTVCVYAVVHSAECANKIADRWFAIFYDTLDVISTLQRRSVPW